MNRFLFLHFLYGLCIIAFGVYGLVAAGSLISLLSSLVLGGALCLVALGKYKKLTMAMTSFFLIFFGSDAFSSGKIYPMGILAMIASAVLLASFFPLLAKQSKSAPRQRSNRRFQK